MRASLSSLPSLRMSGSLDGHRGTFLVEGSGSAPPWCSSRWRLSCAARVPLGRCTVSGSRWSAACLTVSPMSGVETAVEGYRIEPLTPQTWAAFADLAERDNGVLAGAGGCGSAATPIRRSARRSATAPSSSGWSRRVAPDAALVFDGDEAIAWAEYGTVDELPNITTARSGSRPSSRCPTSGSRACSSTARRLEGAPAGMVRPAADRRRSREPSDRLSSPGQLGKRASNCRRRPSGTHKVGK